jgi:anti-anti-sigma factor
MAFKLAVVSRESPNLALVAGYGEATAQAFPVADKVLFDEILGQAWASQRVALDMDAVAFIDSSAIGWLIGVQKRFREAGGLLVLHSLQPHVRNVLGLLRIEKVVPMGRDLEDARKLLTSGGAKGPRRTPLPRGKPARAPAREVAE